MTFPNPLIASTFVNDPRVIQAKQLIAEALKERCQLIQKIKAPDPALETSYQALISKFNDLRGGNLWFPYIGSGIGNGALVELLDGSIKYDCICGIGPHFWGHSHPVLVETAIDAALSDTVMQGNLQQNIDTVELSQLLVEASGLDHCFLTTSGAMANENALKIAFQKKTPASRILTFDNCFFGRSLVGSQITDKPSFREGLPTPYNVDYIPYYNPQHPEESTARAVATLKKHIARYPKQHAVIIFELVQGEGGFNQGSTPFFKVLMQLARDHGIAVLVDEIQTFGRTPELFAYQHYGVEELVDIVTIGKLSQVCATLFRSSYKPLPGLLSQTFTGSTSSIRAGITLIKGLIQGDFFGSKGRIQQIHSYFTEKLQHIAEKHPGTIEGPFGVGCMIAFTPFKGDYKETVQLAHRLFTEGVITFIAGSNPTRIRFLLPAGAIQEKDMNIIADIVEKVLIDRK